jgi:hypothetical protein
MWSAGQADDKERFLADLRALRDAAALGFDELAARAHYPSNVLKEAENGPSLPGLPILAAYVRACDGDVPEWEERWRRLGFEAGADPGLPVRPAGASPAAVAGARAGVSVAPPDAYDPDRIRAALRGSHVQADKAAQASAGQQTASPARGGHDGAGTAWSSTAQKSPGSRGGWGAEPGVAETTHWDAGAAGSADAGWDAAAARNGDAGRDAVGQWNRTASPDAWNREAGQDVWSREAGQDVWSGTASQDVRSGTASQDAEPRWDGGSRWDARPSWDAAADQGSAATNGSHDTWLPEDAAADALTETPDAAATAEALRRDPFSSSWLDDSQPIPPVSDADAGRATADDAEQAPPEWRDFWTPKAAAAPADVQQPTAPPPTDEPAEAETSWSAFTPRSSKITAEPVHRAAPDLAPRAEPAGTLGAATGPTVELPQPPVPAQPVAASAAAPVRSQASAGPAVTQQAPVTQQAAGLPSESRPDRYYPLRLLAVIVVAALIGSVLVMILR